MFNFWLENFLLPSLGSGYTLIMDNAAFHKSEDTKILIKNAGCQLFFLPPYSPDLNPIEKFWANLKAKIKKIIGKFETLSEAIDEALTSDHLNVNQLYIEGNYPPPVLNSRKVFHRHYKRSEAI